MKLQITLIPVLKWTVYCTLRPKSRNFVRHVAASSQMSLATEMPDSTTFGIISIHVVGELTTTALLSHSSRYITIYKILVVV